MYRFYVILHEERSARLYYTGRNLHVNFDLARKYGNIENVFKKIEELKNDAEGTAHSNAQFHVEQCVDDTWVDFDTLTHINNLELL